MGIDQPETLESILGRYGQVTQGLALLMQGKAFFKAPGISYEVSEIYADLLQLVCTVTMEYNDGCRTQDTETMNQNINEAFFVYFSRFNAHWRQITNGILTKLHNSQSHYYTTLDIAAIYEFLDLQDRPLQMIIQGHNHSLADGSFAWFDPHLTAFALGDQDVMAVTGHPGSGKSALFQWTIERLHISAEYDIWNVVNYSIRKFGSPSLLLAQHKLTDHSLRAGCPYNGVDSEYPQGPLAANARPVYPIPEAPEADARNHH